MGERAAEEGGAEGVEREKGRRGLKSKEVKRGLVLDMWLPCHRCPSTI